MHFNPASLQYTVSNTLKDQGSGAKKKQYVSQTTAKLTMDLVFDTTDTGDDVRETTDKMAKLLKPHGPSGKQVPPLVEFGWGVYRFTGMVEQYKETLDFFAASGVPLRSERQPHAVAARTSSSRATRTSRATVDERPDAGAGVRCRPPPVRPADPPVSRTRSAIRAPRARSPRPTAPRACASPRGAELAVGVGAGVSLSGAAAFSAGASAGFGLGISGGAGIGISGGARAFGAVSAGAGIGGVGRIRHRRRRECGRGIGASAGRERPPGGLLRPARDARLPCRCRSAGAALRPER